MQPTSTVERQPGTGYAAEIEKAFLEHHELVYRTAFRITGTASDAEDVLQTLFLRLIRREWLPEKGQGWASYLHRAAVNISLDLVRSRKRQLPLGDTEMQFAETRPDPHGEQSARELRAWFDNAISELNPVAAEMFVLRHVEGYENGDIARMLNTSTGTVAVTLFRTRSRLRKSIRKFLGGS